MRLVNCIFILIFISMAAHAENSDKSQKMQVSLEKTNGNFVVTIKNTSNDFIKINKMLSIDPLIGSIHFVIKEDGVSNQLLGQINPDPVDDGSYIDLHPGAFYGGDYDIKHLEQMFGVKKTCYIIYVYYLDSNADKYNAFRGRVFSRSINVCKPN